MSDQAFLWPPSYVAAQPGWFLLELRFPQKPLEAVTPADLGCTRVPIVAWEIRALYDPDGPAPRGHAVTPVPCDGRERAEDWALEMPDGRVAITLMAAEILRSDPDSWGRTGYVFADEAAYRTFLVDEARSG